MVPLAMYLEVVAAYIAMASAAQVSVKQADDALQLGVKIAAQSKWWEDQANAMLEKYGALLREHRDLLELIEANESLRNTQAPNSSTKGVQETARP